MKFRFSIDDNIIFLKELTFCDYRSVFEHPYLAVFKDLHDRYGVKFQFNLFYQTEGFNLSQMTARFKREWQENASWLKFSFHSNSEFPANPYEKSGYKSVFDDILKIHNEVTRFASADNLSYFTTVHYFDLSKEGLTAAKNAGIKGLVGGFQTESDPRKMLGLGERDLSYLFKNPYLFDKKSGLYFFNNDLIINCHELTKLPKILSKLLGKEFLEVMIHEQYFYPDYFNYQKDFKEKIELVIKTLKDNGYHSVFLEELIAEK